MPNFHRLRTDAVYNTRAVVQKTGVPADTFRAWERRYGLPIPCRTPGNQRLYSERDIATIIWLRDQTAKGLSISQAVALYRCNLTRCEDDPDNPDPIAGVLSRLDHVLQETRAADPVLAGLISHAPGRQSQLHSRIVDALVRFDDADAEQLLAEAMAVLPIEQLCTRVLEPVLVDIEARARRQDVNTAVERFVSGFVLRKLGTLFNLSEPHTGRGPLLAACVEGEQHEFELYLTALFLSKAGYRVIYLGPDLPAAALCATVASIDPTLVLLSASSERSATSLIEAVHALRLQTVQPDNSKSGQPVIAFRGNVFAHNPELRMRIDADFLDCHACEAVERVDRLLADASDQPL